MLDIKLYRLGFAGEGVNTHLFSLLDTSFGHNISTIHKVYYSKVECNQLK